VKPEMNRSLTLTQPFVGDIDISPPWRDVSVFSLHIPVCVIRSSQIRSNFFLLNQNRMAANQTMVQLDLPFSNGNFFSLPKFLPGRVNVDDFVFFNIPRTMHPLDYMVAVESLDTSNPHSPIRTIGPLRDAVELPHVQFDAYAAVFVLPKNDPTKPTFFARLNRGSTYDISDVSRAHRPGGKYEMRRHGMLTAGADQSKLAY
jgi:hypothetical protein